MRKGVRSGVAVCLLVASATTACVLKHKALVPTAVPVMPAAPVAMAAPVAADAGVGAPPDAGQQVAEASFARPPVTDEPWDISPPARLSTGETFPTVQAAVDAAQPGQTILLARGIYPTAVKLSEKKNIQLVAREGPAWFITTDASAPALSISKCEGIGLEGLWVELSPGLEGSSPLIDIEKSDEVRLRSVYVGPGQQGIRASLSSGLLLEDLLAEEHSEDDLRIESPAGPVVIRHSWFASPAHPVAMVSETVDWESPEFWTEAPPEDEPIEAPLTVEDSVFAGGLWFNVPANSPKLSRTVVRSGDERVAAALLRRVGSERLLDSAQEAAPTDAQRAALADNRSLLLRASESSLPADVLPGAEWTQKPGDRERTGAQLALARHERGIPTDSEARVWIFESGRSYPLCGPSEAVPVLDKPEGTEVTTLVRCERDLGTMQLSTYVIESQQDGWLKLDKGWVRESKVSAGQMVTGEDWVVPLPLFHARIVSRENGELTIQGDSDVCAREHCADTSSEQGPENAAAAKKSEPEPEPELPWESTTVPVPNWLPVIDDEHITTFHDPECCPC